MLPSLQKNPMRSSCFETPKPASYHSQNPCNYIFLPMLLITTNINWHSRPVFAWFDALSCCNRIEWIIAWLNKQVYSFLNKMVFMMYFMLLLQFTFWFWFQGQFLFWNFLEHVQSSVLYPKMWPWLFSKLKKEKMDILAYSATGN